MRTIEIGNANINVKGQISINNSDEFLDVRYENGIDWEAEYDRVRHNQARMEEALVDRPGEDVYVTGLIDTNGQKQSTWIDTTGLEIILENGDLEIPLTIEDSDRPFDAYPLKLELLSEKSREELVKEIFFHYPERIEEDNAEGLDIYDCFLEAECTAEVIQSDEEIATGNVYISFGDNEELHARGSFGCIYQENFDFANPSADEILISNIIVPNPYNGDSTELTDEAIQDEVLSATMDDCYETLRSMNNTNSIQR